MGERRDERDERKGSENKGLIANSSLSPFGYSPFTYNKIMS